MPHAARIGLFSLGAWLVACGSTEPGPRPSDGDAGFVLSPPSTPPQRDAGEPVAASGGGDVATTDAGTSEGLVTADVGQSGGHLSLPDGASVEIPRGALASLQHIAIRIVDDPVALPAGQELRGLAYAFEPHGQRFAMPVTLRLPFTGDADGLTAVRLDDDRDTSWTIVDGGEARAAQVFELEVSHFSIYAVATAPEPPDAAVDVLDAAVDAAVVSPCETDNGGCDPLTACVDQGGEASCGDCPSGYTGTGATSCVDIDECAAGALVTCGPGATACENVPGDFSCTCDAQHTGTGTHQCIVPLLCEPLVAILGETCYDFTAHGTSSPSDTTKFNVPTGESIDVFYFDVPWPNGTVASRTGFIADAAAIVADAWLFDSGSSNAGGTVAANVTGTVLGDDAALLDHWGPGGCELTLPADVGLHLPAPTRRVMLELHYHNSTGAPQQDASTFRVCTVAPGTRANVAGLTMLGTENLGGATGIPTGASMYSSPCMNDSAAPITLISLTPHAHRYGTRFEAVITHTAGGNETVLDQPYDFDYQVRYDTGPAVIAAGDTLTTTCSFDNTSGASVAFGMSTQQEMCFVFALSYPYGALDNNVLSLLGATNTCW